jgi:Galactose oxidase, central domain/Kelch motif
MIRTNTHRFAAVRTFGLAALFAIGLVASTPSPLRAASGSSGSGACEPPSPCSYGFVLTGSLNTARYGHTATLLSSGRVLVTGGLGPNGIYAPLASAEIYNPAKGKWAVTGSMSMGRTAFTATLLPNGEVLVAGGTGFTANCFSTAELYNPSTGSWTATGSMTQPRCLHMATLLPSGEVLVAGGVDSLFNSPNTAATAELYNPSTGVWQTTGSLNVARATAAALLENGQVLVAGGYNTFNNFFTYLASAELYNPSTAQWSFTASMQAPNSSPTTPVLLTNSDVLIADGHQFYNPAMAAWTSTGALPKTAGPPAVASLLNTGNVLASGTRCNYNGCGNAPSPVCFLYTFSSNSWSAAGLMNKARLGHTSTLLPSGKVLIVGGYSTNQFIPTNSAELYTP